MGYRTAELQFPQPSARARVQFSQSLHGAARGSSWPFDTILRCNASREDISASWRSTCSEVALGDVYVTQDRRFPETIKKMRRVGL